jgi:hypothetical protein
VLFISKGQRTRGAVRCREMGGFTRVFRLKLNSRLDPGTVVEKLGVAVGSLFPNVEIAGEWDVRAKSLLSSKEDDDSMMFIVNMNTSKFEYLLKDFAMVTLKKNSMDDRLKGYRTRREGIIQGKQYQCGDYNIRIGVRAMSQRIDSVIIEVEHRALSGPSIAMELISKVVAKLSERFHQQNEKMELGDVDLFFPPNILTKLFETYGLLTNGVFIEEHLALQHLMLIK